MASQKRPYCAFLNSHYPVGLVSRQWDGVDWSCVLCDRRDVKISSDWLPSYIKATRPVQEIFKTNGHFPDSPLIRVFWLQEPSIM